MSFVLMVVVKSVVQQYASKYICSWTGKSFLFSTTLIVPRAYKNAQIW